ncbi:MAG: sn-glycerol-3-phosphate ABC transporter ATP-binding protein UgpC [Tagaea sp.]|nr:sn-glycerol-3-phosphate ABC transporter ATP-binding protein UgpC [Tagaea sp.]
MATVTLDRLTKRYDGAAHPAVDAVTLDVAHGEFMVFLGPSGCGKTTTLRMIAGLESISAGGLVIDGKSMNAVPAKDRDIAMVFQSYALYPHMTVADNLAFGLRRRGIDRAEIESRVTRVAATLGLDKLLARKPHALSGGQRQRVALGRAIVRDPKVFLFDEPLSNLDAALRVATRAEIARLHRELGATMIYVTHDQVEAMTMGTRICIMSGGKVAQLGRPLDIYREPADTFVAGFLGNPAMNLIDAMADDSGRIRVGAMAVAIGPERIKPIAPGVNLVFGIRPEHIALTPGPNAAPALARVAGIEPLGAETILALRFDGVAKDVIARLPGDVATGIGATLTVHLDLQHAHAFDAAGRSLRP